MPLDVTTPAPMQDLHAIWDVRTGGRPVPRKAFIGTVLQLQLGASWSFRDAELSPAPLMLGGICTAGGNREAWFFNGPAAGRAMLPLVRAIRDILAADYADSGEASTTRTLGRANSGAKLARLLGFRLTDEIALHQHLWIWRPHNVQRG